MDHSAHVCKLTRAEIPNIDEDLDVSLVISYGLQDESNVVVSGKVIRILFQHIYDECSLWLGQKLGRFGILSPHQLGEMDGKSVNSHRA